MNKSSLAAALAIAQNDLACYAKNRIAIFWTFVGPALCMWLFGFLTPSASTLKPVVFLPKASDPILAEALMDALRQNGHAVTEAEHSPLTGFSIEVKSAGSSPVVLLHTSEDGDAAEQSLRYEIDAELLSLAAARSGETGKPAVIVDELTLPSAANAFQRTVPAYLIMFLTMNLLVSGASFADERESGRMRRLLIAPFPAICIIAGRLASRLVVAWVQMAVLLSIGVFLLGIHWSQHVTGLIFMLSLYVLAMGSAGIVIGTYFKDPDKASAFAMWSALILAPLTGLWWPVELMPAALQTMAHLLPTGWVMQSVNSMLSSGAKLSDFRLITVGLIAVASVSLWVSARGLKTSQ